MNCTNFRNSIFSWSENDFSAFSAAELEAHSKECADCSFLLEEFRKTMAIIEQEKRIEPNPFAETRLLQKLENYKEAENWWDFPVPKPFLRPIYLGLGITAAILLGVVMGFEEGGIYLNLTSKITNIESVRSELNVPDIMGEDIIEFSNQ